MDDDVVTVDAAVDLWADVDPTLRPPKKYPKWPFVLAGILFLLGLATTALLVLPIDVPYYTMSPGPVFDTSDFVEVGDRANEHPGELFFLTIVLKEANLFEYIGARFDPAVEVAPRQNIRPPDVSPEQLRRENLALMAESKTDAIFVALTQLGYEPVYIGTGALVIDTVPDSAADGLLLPDDVIVEMDGKPIDFRSDLIELLADKQIGDPVDLVVERFRDDAVEADTMEITLVLGPHTDEPDRPMIGILLDNNTPVVEFPIEVSIDSQNIGGPSAGLMLALQVMDQLGDDPLTKGHRIAGTGTIRRDGVVGAIGGVRQKVFGAIDMGAHAVLVPAANFAEAAEAAGDRITVVSVGTIDDALAFLATLPA